MNLLRLIMNGLLMLGLLDPALVMASQQNSYRPAQAVLGLWVNPRGTVKVETRDCGDQLCGWVVWADPKAQSDARKGGSANLIGTQLLYDYHATQNGRWMGEVFVPDMGRRLSSKLDLIDQNRIKISGCLIAGFFCKSQIWRRG